MKGPCLARGDGVKMEVECDGNGHIRSGRKRGSSVVP